MENKHFLRLRGAIFDMDGTLVDSLFYWDALWRRIGETFLSDADFRPSEEDDKRVRTMLFRDAMALIQETYRIPLPPDGLWQFAAADEERFYREDVFAKAGVLDFLEYLKQEGVRMCVVSATDRQYLPIALTACGLSEYFEFLLSCEELGVGKDRPDAYLAALSRLGMEAKDVAVFEDSYVALETAKRIGCPTIGVYDRYNFAGERLKAAADIYLDENHTMTDLIGCVGL